MNPEADVPARVIRDKMPLLFGGLAIAACALTILDQLNCWNAKDDYLFGYLVPVFCVFVIKERWGKIRQIFTEDVSTADADAEDEFSPPGFIASGTPAPLWLNAIFVAGTLFSLLIFSTGALGSAIYGFDAFTTYQNSAGFVGLAFGLAWFASGTDLNGRALDMRSRFRVLALLVFPICVWFVSGPLTFLVDREIKGILLTNVTGAVVFLLNIFGFDLTQSANTIILPGGDQVGIEDACSGVRSLTACIFTGSFLAAIFMHSVKKKILFVGISVLFALFLNVMRSSFLTIWASIYGSGAIELDFLGNAPESAEFTLGTVHDIAGWGAMIITFALMAALVPVVNIKREKTDAEMGLTFVDDDEDGV